MLTLVPNPSLGGIPLRKELEENRFMRIFRRFLVERRTQRALRVWLNLEAFAAELRACIYGGGQ